MRPFIGITVNYETVNVIGRATNLGTEGQDWNYLAGDYVYAIERAGGVPVLIPRCEDEEDLVPLLEKLDGVLVSGGHDVRPLTYGERMRGECGPVVPERDAYDVFVSRWCLEHGKPLLGICRGVQIMNAAFGGTVYQDLEKDGGFAAHSLINSPRNAAAHSVAIKEGSLLREIFGPSLMVNSFHHQAVKDLALCARAVAFSEDGVIEACEFSGGHPFCLAVQWHPEMMFDSAEQQKLFSAFVRACGPDHEGARQ